MSQNDMVVANQGFAAFRTDMNSALQALASNAKGSSAPSTKYAGQLWLDDTATPWVLNIWDGAQWIVVAEINASTNVGVPWGAVGSRVVAKVAGYTIAAVDRGELHTQSGTYTVTLPAAATVGDGWSITIVNIGSGTITIDGNAAETINGSANVTLTTQYSGLHLVCDGSAWVATTVTVPAQATQAAMEAETNEDTYVPPDLVKHSPGIAKCWARISANGTTVDASYNVTSHTDNGVGQGTITIAVDFSSTSYAISGSLLDSSGSKVANFKPRNAPAAGSFDYLAMVDETAGDTMAATDTVRFMAAFGDQ